MNSKQKGRIISALRRLTFSYEPRNNVKNRYKKGPATFECENCSMWVYEGSRDINTQLEKLDSEPPVGLIKGKINMDHIEPIVPLEGFKRGFWDWDEYMTRMFCEEEGYACLCKECHDLKSDQENDIRKKYRQKSLTKKSK